MVLDDEPFLAKLSVDERVAGLMRCATIIGEGVYTGVYRDVPNTSHVMVNDLPARFLRQKFVSEIGDAPLGGMPYFVRKSRD